MRCTLAADSLHDGVQHGGMSGCSSAAGSVTGLCEVHGALHVHKGCATPSTADAEMGPK